jgi:D-proline reductase (dithiol) PrdB
MKDTNLPVPYMERTRQFYEAQGFTKAYAWAHFDDIPFTPLEKPLADCRLGYVTTASTYARAATDARFVDSGSMSSPPERLYGDDLSWDREATHMNDRSSYFPVGYLNAMVADGRVGGLADRFHCIPTEYSQRRTLESDAPEILRRLNEDQIDIALLVPL